MTEPIAIVGVGCRLPGDHHDSTNFPQFESFVLRGGDAVGQIPESRWSLETTYSPDRNVASRMYVQRGAFMDWDFRQFDAELYGISPREAAIMDPQQRLLLDVALDCLHDTKADFDQLHGSRTGVYIGGFMLDHLTNNSHTAVRERHNSHSPTSAQMTMLSNRLSYTFGMQGPSMTVDTACSSSLVAVHLACQALQTGDADFCLAGGVNFMLQAATFMMLCQGQFLAEDGRSKSFDAAADGYGRGEGCAVVGLKRLADAQADGDDVYAVIRGTGSNQDGATSGITVPNPDAQSALIDRVFGQADVSLADLGYFEAHGTGTPLGDPIELRALRSSLEAAGADQPVVVGSVKAGIGHLEAAAGIAGLLKAVATVRSGHAGPQAWLEELNPLLPLEDSAIAISRDQPTPVGSANGPTVAAVNSFGYGGTNAHVLVSSSA